MAEPTTDPPPPPVPDPTILTTQQMLRSVSAERDYVDGQLAVLRERLRGIDVATSLLNETVNRVPTDVTQQVTHLRELIDARLAAVQQQFRERDTRAESESRASQVAVNAAFSAQKEAAAQQDMSNQKASDKTERLFIETIRTNGDLARAQNDAIRDRVSALELAITALQSVKQGGRETISGIYAFVGLIATLLVIGGVIAAVLATR